MRNSVEETGLPEHGVAHPPQVTAFERATGALEHGERGGRAGPAGGRARDHLVRGQHGGVAVPEEVVVVELVPLEHLLPPGRADGHLHRSRLVVRRRWPGALRPRGHRDGPGGRGRGLGWRQRAAAAGRRGGGGRDGRLATEQRPRGSRGGSGRAPSSPTATAEQEPLVPLVQRGEEPDLPLRHPARAPGPLPRPRARGRRGGGGREQEVVLMELIPCHERRLRRGRRRRREHPDEPLARRRPSRPVLVHGQSQRRRMQPGARRSLSSLVRAAGARDVVWGGRRRDEREGGARLCGGLAFMGERRDETRPTTGEGRGGG